MYDYFGNREDTILGESKQRKRFVKAGRSCCLNYSKRQIETYRHRQVTLKCWQM